MADQIAICALHEKLDEVVTDTSGVIAKTSNDVGWIKIIAWGILVIAVSFSASVWGIFYPFMTHLSERVTKVENTIAVNSKRLEYQEKADEDSKQDRKEIKQALDNMRKLIEDTHREAMGKK